MANCETVSLYTSFASCDHLQGISPSVVNCDGCVHDDKEEPDSEDAALHQQTLYEQKP